MKIIASCAEMLEHSRSLQKEGLTVGFVPTMGALHRGHLSLLSVARQHCDYIVMSIFVNPAQFGPSEDFEKYPRQLERDCELAKSAGCDCVFTPQAKDIYPDDYYTYVNVNCITDTLCGASREGHFRGVATVVLKLFNIVTPNIAVFGAKDAQQVVVIKRMAADLNVPVNIIAAPTVREEDGLAMSSRNAYLSAAERIEASLIYKGLAEAKRLYYGEGERASGVIKNRIASIISEDCLIQPEYIEIVDTKLLKPVSEITVPVLLAVACRTVHTNTRLIDNIVLGGDL